MRMRPPTNDTLPKWLGALGLLTLVGVVLLAVLPALGRDRAPSGAPPRTFDGASDGLRGTVVVPTLDTPFPAERSAVWCASFPMAWKALSDEVIRAPIRVAGAEAVADRLNRAQVPALPRAATYHAAGVVTPDLLRTIRTEMKRRFPSAPAPELNVPPGALLAYAYLAASVPFRIPFFENDEPLSFRGTNVASFGLRPKDEYAYYGLRRQVQVLHAANMYDRGPEANPTFVVDPDRTSKPFQLLLARVERHYTLAETWAAVEAHVRAAEGRDETSALGPNDVLLVPAMHWRIRHRFRELEGIERKILNPGFEAYWIDTAEQVIDFRLDKSGADLKSEAKLYALPEPSLFVFDRPFLVAMRARGETKPFFVLWVANAELLVKVR